MDDPVRGVAWNALPVVVLFVVARMWHGHAGLEGRALVEATFQTLGGHYLASMVLNAPLARLAQSLTMFVPTAMVVPPKHNYSKYEKMLLRLRQEGRATEKTLAKLQHAVDATARMVWMHASGIYHGSDSKIGHNFAYLDCCFSVLLPAEPETSAPSMADVVDELEQMIAPYDESFRDRLRTRVLKPFVSGSSNALWLHGPHGVGKTRFASELARVTRCTLVDASFGGGLLKPTYDPARDWEGFSSGDLSFHAKVAASARGNTCIALMDEADKAMERDPAIVMHVLRNLQGNTTIFDPCLGIDVPTTHTCVVFTANQPPSELVSAKTDETFCAGELESLASRVVCVPFPALSPQTKRTVLEKKLGTPLPASVETLLLEDTSPGVRELLIAAETLVRAEETYASKFMGTKWA